MANPGERDENNAVRGTGREAERGESTYRGEAGERERSTPGRPGSRLVPDEEERNAHAMQGGADVRDGALRGPAEGTGGDRAMGGGARTNPPQVDDAGSEGMDRDPDR